MGVGKQFELHIKNKVMEHTDADVVAIRPDFSGSSKYSVSDVIIMYPRENGIATPQIRGALIELKKRRVESGRRTTVMSGSSQGDSGLDELTTLVEHTPPWARSYVAVKFNRAEMQLMDATKLLVQLRQLDSEDRTHVGESFCEARLTASNNISMRKHGGLPSQTLGVTPWKVVCNELDIQHDE